MPKTLMQSVISELQKERKRLEDELHRVAAALTAFGNVYLHGGRPTRKSELFRMRGAGELRLLNGRGGQRSRELPPWGKNITLNGVFPSRYSVILYLILPTFKQGRSLIMH